MSKKAVLRAGALIAAMAAAPLAAAQEGQFYLGGSFGEAEARGVCDDVRTLVSGIGSVSTCDEKDSAWKIFGGYQINRNVAVEVTYFDYGAIAAAGQTFGVPFTLAGDATAFGAAAVVSAPLGERFALFGKLGLLRSETDVAASGVGGSAAESDSEIGLHIGIGAFFHIARSVSLRAEWERNDELEVDMMSLGAQIRF